jgi:putative ATP-binding cassette transporter
MYRDAADFLRALWALSRPYWSSPAARFSWLQLIGLIALNLGMIWLNVRFNEWNRLFFNTLQDKNVAAFWRELANFGLIAGGLIVAAVARQYVNQWLQIRWREAMTADLRDRWLKARTFYAMQVLGLAADNPDQRISDDVRNFVQYTLKLSLEFLVNLITVIAFIGILWNLSGEFALTFGAAEIPIPGSLVWLAIVYALAGSILTYFIGRPLAGLNFEQERRNADFRFLLMRLRENAQAVALSGGEDHERAALDSRFARIAENWRRIMLRQVKITGFTTFHAQIAAVLPILVSAPRYFSGELQLGSIFQIGNAFAQLYASLSWFITSFTQLAEWRATVSRLTSLIEAMEQGAAARGPATVEGGKQNALEIAGLNIALPGGRALFSDYAVELKEGERTLITGRSGSGKSTLFGAVSGLWPFGSGRILRPVGRRLMFLPQKPYLPLGTLADAIAYPGLAANLTDTDLLRALDQVGLGRLGERLRSAEAWGQILSLGEQQRLAFARPLLVRPDWLFLDEATSSLDESAEAEMYRLLREALPAITIVSIGHRATLRGLHDRTIEIVPPAAS